MIASVIISLISLVFIGMGIYAWRKKTPMHFWSGTTVKSEEIENIPAYNKANGIMWIVYGLSYLIGWQITCHMDSALGALVFVGVVIGGLIFMVISYGKIYNKYKKKK